MTDQPSATDLPMPITALTKAQKMQIVNLVRRAAKAEILPRFRKAGTLQVTTKSGAMDLVTAADLAAEAMITRGLQSAFPNAVIVGEEACETNPGLRDKIADAELCFLIDPVDGTWNFANGLATFGTIVAACRFGRPVFGLIYDPLADDFVSADLDTASHYAPRFGAAKTLRTAAPKAFKEMAGVIHLKLFDAAQQAAVAALYPRLAKPTSLSCSAHEYRLLAQGAVDFVLASKQTPWDHAAGALICAQAGGHVAMLGGGEYSAALTEGYLLSASSKATWDLVSSALAFLQIDSAGPAEIENTQHNT